MLCYYVPVHLQLLILSLCWQARRESPDNFPFVSRNFQNLARQVYKSCTKTAFYRFWGAPKYILKLEFCLKNLHGSYASGYEAPQKILETCDFSIVHSEWVKFTVISTTTTTMTIDNIGGPYCAETMVYMANLNHSPGRCPWGMCPEMV